MTEQQAELLADILGDPRVAGDDAVKLLDAEPFAERALRQALEPLDESPPGSSE